MVKYTFNINNGIELNQYRYLGPIYEARRQVADASGLGIGQNLIILEDFGTTLTQGAWTNEDGLFLTYRISPCYSHLPKAQEAAKAFEIAINKIFGGQNSRREVVDPNDPKSLIHLYFSGGLTSIGD
jgi:hypothetical protein